MGRTYTHTYICIYISFNGPEWRESYRASLNSGRLWIIRHSPETTTLFPHPPCQERANPIALLVNRTYKPRQRGVAFEKRIPNYLHVCITTATGLYTEILGRRFDQRYVRRSQIRPRARIFREKERICPPLSTSDAANLNWKTGRG